MIHIYSEPSQKFALFSGEPVKDPTSFAKQNGDSKYREYLFRPSIQSGWLVERTDAAKPGASDLRLVALDNPGRDFLRELCSVSAQLSPEDGCNLIFTLLDPAARAVEVGSKLAALPPAPQPVPQSVPETPPQKERPRAYFLSLLIAALAGALIMFLVWMAVDSRRPHEPYRTRPAEGRHPR